MPKLKADVAILNVRVSEDAKALLGALCTVYAARMGSADPISQAKAVDLMIREAAAREGLTKATRKAGSK